MAGLEMPVIVRPTEEALDAGTRQTYRLVSHAYLHGAMRGELWSDEYTQLLERMGNQGLEENEFGIIEMTLV